MRTDESGYIAHNRDRNINFSPSSSLTFLCLILSPSPLLITLYLTVMLSAESAAGKYPVESVTMQQLIINKVEVH